MAPICILPSSRLHPVADWLGACPLHVVSSGLAGLSGGQMAWIDAAVSLILSALLPVSISRGANRHLVPEGPGMAIHDFYVYALAGLALCGVGIYDRKGSAIWRS
jgi:hypothetical protein